MSKLRSCNRNTTVYWSAKRVHKTKKLQPRMLPTAKNWNKKLTNWTKKGKWKRRSTRKSKNNSGTKFPSLTRRLMPSQKISSNLRVPSRISNKTSSRKRALWANPRPNRTWRLSFKIWARALTRTMQWSNSTCNRHWWRSRTCKAKIINWERNLTRLKTSWTKLPTDSGDEWRSFYIFSILFQFLITY